jgi:hypothetical protein
MTPNTTNERTVYTALRGFYEEHVQALQGMLDKLPEAARTELKQLKDGLNEQLKKLPPIDQVPAAQEAGWALNCIASAIERGQTYATGLLERTQQLSTEYAGKLTALSALEGRVSAGDLLTKEQVKGMCDEARGAGRKELEPVILGMRTRQVELAGLPNPGEAILGLPEAEFTPKFDAAVKHAKLIAEKKGWKNKTLLGELAWLGETEFAGKLTMFEEMVSGTAPTTPGRQADPLLGDQNPGGGGGAGDAPQRRVRLI